MPVEMFGSSAQTLSLCMDRIREREEQQRKLDSLYVYSRLPTSRELSLNPTFRDTCLNRRELCVYAPYGEVLWSAGSPLPNPNRPDLGRPITKVTDLFRGCSKVVSLDLSEFDLTSCDVLQGMFTDCSGLLSVSLTGLRVRKIGSVRFMFQGCSSLLELDVSFLTGTRPRLMDYMFDGCSSLERLNVSGLDTSGATRMPYMFRSCSSLTELDLSGFDLAKTNELKGMFDGCTSLRTLWARTQADADRLNNRAVTGLPEACTATVRSEAGAD